MGVALSADGTRLVTASSDATARVWDTGASSPLLELKGHAHEVTCAVVSADGTRVVTGAEDNAARVWDARTGACLLELTGHYGSVGAVAFTPDGGRVVTGSGDGTARVWDGRTGKCLHELAGHPGPVWFVAVAADGRRVVTWSADNAARVWDIETGRHLPAEPVPPTAPVSNRMPDGRLAIESGNRVLLVDPRVGADERARRLWATRPDPDWHAARANQFGVADPAAAALHRSFEHHARGVLALEDGDPARAWWHFVAAAALRRPPKPVETAPPPRRANR
jgi:WD40 repeat protein